MVVSANEGKPVRLVRKLSAIATVAVAGIALSACSLLGGDAEPGPTQAEGETTVATPTVDPTFAPGGGAEENKAFFDKTLQDLLAADPEAGARELVNSLASAGFDKSQMEVTPDKTSVDLDADFVIVSVKMPDGVCLVGQTGTSGYASMVAEPMESTGKCLIGKNLEIDW